MCNNLIKIPSSIQIVQMSSIQNSEFLSKFETTETSQTIQTRLLLVIVNTEAPVNILIDFMASLCYLYTVNDRKQTL
jgi:hypothetical protein